MALALRRVVKVAPFGVGSAVGATLAGWPVSYVVLTALCVMTAAALGFAARERDHHH